MRRYAARMEFLAVVEEVEKLIGQGASYVLAYEKLHEEEKITMSYYTFYSYARKENPSKQQVHESTLTQEKTNKVQTAPRKEPILAGFKREKTISEMLHPTTEELDEII